MFTKLNDFVSAQAGSISITFAIAALSVISIAGMAIDYSRLLNQKSSVQNVLDASTMGAALHFRKTFDKGVSETYGLQMFDDYCKSRDCNQVAAPTIEIHPDDRFVEGKVRAEMKTTMLRLIGFDTVDFDLIAEVGLPNPVPEIAEIVFVLDFSDTMEDDNEAVIKATTAAIVSLTDNLVNKDVTIGLVPFAEFVYMTLPGEHVLGGTPGTPWTNCTRGPKWPFNTRDVIPDQSVPDSLFGRTDENDSIDADEYKDCPGYASDGLIVRPLSDDHATTVAHVANLKSNWGTNLLAGTQIAWRLLSSKPPFQQASPYWDPNVRKIVILVTDGYHNRKDWGPKGTFSVNQARSNLQDVCTNMKMMDIEIFALAYEFPDSDPDKNGLKSCTSGAEYFYDGEEANLVETMGLITNAITGGGNMAHFIK